MNPGTPQSIVDNIETLLDPLYVQSVQRERNKPLFDNKIPLYDCLARAKQEYDPENKLTAICGKIREQLENKLNDRVGSYAICVEISNLIEAPQVPAQFKKAIRDGLLNKIKMAQIEFVDSTKSPDEILWQKFYQRMKDLKQKLLEDLKAAYKPAFIEFLDKDKKLYFQVKKLIDDFDVKSDESFDTATLFNRKYAELENAIQAAFRVQQKEITPAFLLWFQDTKNSLFAKLATERVYVQKTREVSTQQGPADQKDSLVAPGPGDAKKEEPANENDKRAKSVKIPQEFEVKQKALLLKEAEELARVEIEREIAESKGAGANFQEIFRLQKRLIEAEKTLAEASARLHANERPEPLDAIKDCRRVRLELLAGQEQEQRILKSIPLDSLLDWSSQQDAVSKTRAAFRERLKDIETWEKTVKKPFDQALAAVLECKEAVNNARSHFHSTDGGQYPLFDHLREQATKILDEKTYTVYQRLGIAITSVIVDDSRKEQNANNCDKVAEFVATKQAVAQERYDQAIKRINEKLRDRHLPAQAAPAPEQTNGASQAPNEQERGRQEAIRKAKERIEERRKKQEQQRKQQEQQQVPGEGQPKSLLPQLVLPPRGPAQVTPPPVAGGALPTAAPGAPQLR